MRLVQVQKRVEDRLTAWAHDLERTTGEIEGQVSRLEALQKERLAKVERTLDPGGRGAAGRGRRAARRGACGLREEIQNAAAEAIQQATNELEQMAAERRRALHEVGERLRRRERDLREQISARGGRRGATAAPAASPTWSAGRPNGSRARSSARRAASSRRRRRSSTRQFAPRATKPSAGSPESSTTRSPSTRAEGCAISRKPGGSQRRATSYLALPGVAIAGR